MKSGNNRQYLVNIFLCLLTASDAVYLPWVSLVVKSAGFSSTMTGFVLCLFCGGHAIGVRLSRLAVKSTLNGALRRLIVFFLLLVGIVLQSTAVLFLPKPGWEESVCYFPNSLTTYYPQWQSDSSALISSTTKLPNKVFKNITLPTNSSSSSPTKQSYFTPERHLTSSQYLQSSRMTSTFPLTNNSVKLLSLSTKLIPTTNFTDSVETSNNQTSQFSSIGMAKSSTSPHATETSTAFSSEQQIETTSNPSTTELQLQDFTVGNNNSAFALGQMSSQTWPQVINHKNMTTSSHISTGQQKRKHLLQKHKYKNKGRHLESPLKQEIGITSNKLDDISVLPPHEHITGSDSENEEDIHSGQIKSDQQYKPLTFPMYDTFSRGMPDIYVDNRDDKDIYTGFQNWIREDSSHGNNNYYRSRLKIPTEKEDIQNNKESEEEHTDRQFEPLLIADSLLPGRLKQFPYYDGGEQSIRDSAEKGHSYPIFATRNKRGLSTVRGRSAVNRTDKRKNEIERNPPFHFHGLSKDPVWTVAVLFVLGIMLYGGIEPAYARLWHCFCNGYDTLLGDRLQEEDIIERTITCKFHFSGHPHHRSWSCITKAIFVAVLPILAALSCIVGFSPERIYTLQAGFHVSLATLALVTLLIVPIPWGGIQDPALRRPLSLYLDDEVLYEGLRRLGFQCWALLQGVLTSLSEFYGLWLIHDNWSCSVVGIQRSNSAYIFGAQALAVSSFLIGEGLTYPAQRWFTLKLRITGLMASGCLCIAMHFVFMAAVSNSWAAAASFNVLGLGVALSWMAIKDNALLLAMTRDQEREAWTSWCCWQLGRAIGAMFWGFSLDAAWSGKSLATLFQTGTFGAVMSAVIVGTAGLLTRRSSSRRRIYHTLDFQITSPEDDDGDEDQEEFSQEDWLVARAKKEGITI